MPMPHHELFLCTETNLPSLIRKSPNQKASQSAERSEIKIGCLSTFLAQPWLKGTQAGSDGFKYGFPTCGSDRNEEKREVKTSKKKERKLKNWQIMVPDTLQDNGEKPNSGNGERNINPQGTGLLSHVRKSAAEDERNALRLGVHQGYGLNVLGRTERNLVLWIFNSSLPEPGGIGLLNLDGW